MGFFDLFIGKEEKVYINGLHQKFTEHFPDLPEDRIIILACLSGLLARVAYVDFEIHEDEVAHMEKALTHWLKVSADEAKFVAQTAVDEIKSLSGLDNRKFCTPLVDLLSVDERYHVLETLFELAATDGIVEMAETNEISYIAKSLVLEHKYFVAAKATVKDYLASLK